MCSGVTKPRMMARPASISSAAIEMSTSPCEGDSAKTGSRPAVAGTSRCSRSSRRCAGRRPRPRSTARGSRCARRHRRSSRPARRRPARRREDGELYHAAVAGASAASAWMRPCPASAKFSLRLFAPALQEADHGAAHAVEEAVPAARIVHHVGAVEATAEHGGVRHLAAVAAADAVLVDMGDRVVAQRIVERLHRQRRAAGEPHAGVVAGADVLVDAEFRLHHALAALDRLVDQRLFAGAACSACIPTRRR